MKIYISTLVLVLFTTLIFSQKLTESGKGYSEVVEVELNKDEIYQKLKEWISLTYKSSNDVVQLDTKEKIITKGNTVVNFAVTKYKFDYRISITMVFTIKDNKYKIDLTPTGISTVTPPYTEVGTGMLDQIMTAEVMSKEDYLISLKKSAFGQYKLMGYSDEKSQKMINKYEKTLIESYDLYPINKETFEREIKSLYTSVKNAVNKKEDW